MGPNLRIQGWYDILKLIKVIHYLKKERNQKIVSVVAFYVFDKTRYDS